MKEVVVLLVRSKLVNVIKPVLVAFIVTPPPRAMAELARLPVLNITLLLSTLAVLVGALAVMLLVP